MLAFAENVRFRGARNAVARMEEIIEKTAERRIFGATARYVARKNAKERVDDKKRGKQGGIDAADEPLGNTAKKCESEGDVIDGIGAVSTVEKTGEAIAEIAAKKTHGEDPFLIFGELR